jgi:hypothetical protein
VNLVREKGVLDLVTLMLTWTAGQPSGLSPIVGIQSASQARQIRPVWQPDRMLLILDGNGEGYSEQKVSTDRTVYDTRRRDQEKVGCRIETIII